MTVDVLAFGAHPDDVELCCSGTLIKLIGQGYSVGIVDMSWAEMSTRGTVETRKKETAAATKILGAVARENLGLKDTNIRVDMESKKKVADVVRKYQPKLVFLPYFKDRHPDHYHTSELVYEGIFLAGLPTYQTDLPSFRPKQILYYMAWDEFVFSFVVDITKQHEQKMAAIYAYETQFKPDDNYYQETKLTSKEYNWALHSRMAYYGSLIGKTYGEAFLIRGNIEVTDPLKLNFASF